MDVNGYGLFLLLGTLPVHQASTVQLIHTRYQENREMDVIQNLINNRLSDTELEDLIQHLESLGLDINEVTKQVISSLNWVNFAETYLRNPLDSSEPLRLWPWQKKFITTIQMGAQMAKDAGVRKEGVAVNCPRQVGKTETMAAAIVAMMFVGNGHGTPPSEIVVVSITEDKSKEFIRRALGFIENSPELKKYLPHRIHGRTEKRRIHLLDPFKSKVFASPPTDSILGESAHWLVLDEISRMDDEFVCRAATPILRSKGLECGQISASTPAGDGNEHWERILGPKSDMFHVLNLKDDIDIIDGEIVKYHPLNPRMKKEQYVNEWRLLGGDLWASQELNAEFVAGSNSVFHQNDIKKAYREHMQAVSEGQPHINYILGADFARVHDRTAIAVVHANEAGAIVLDHLESHYKRDWRFQLDRIKQIVKKFNVAMVVPDSTGLGDYPTESIQYDLPGVAVFRQTGSNRPGFFFNQQSKTALIETLAGEFSTNNVHLIEHDGRRNPHSGNDINWECYKLESEFMSYRWETPESAAKGSYAVRYPKPRGGDDRLIAFALAAYGLRRKFVRTINPVTYGKAPTLLKMPSIGAKAGSSSRAFATGRKYSLPIFGSTRSEFRSRGSDEHRRAGRSWRLI